jgi:hypothetical protein
MADAALGSGTAVHGSAPGNSGANREWTAPPMVHEVLRSPGRPLDESSLSFFGTVYGHDFSQVRIHSDDRAAASARAVHARAYTVGNDIVLDGAGRSPSSAGGRGLLAHELAHVARPGARTVLRRQPKEGGEAGGKIGPLVQKFLRGEATEKDKETLRQQLMADQLTPDEVDAIKKYLARTVADAVMQQAFPGFPGQVGVKVGGPIGDVHTFFKARLTLRLSGALKTLASGFEGSIEAVAEVTADANRKKVFLDITPPPGDSLLSALAKTLAFQHGVLHLELGETALEVLNMVSLHREITLVITGNKDSKAGGIVLSSPSLPEDIELLVTLSQSAERPNVATAIGTPALPPWRAFATGGPVGTAAGTGAGATLGLDLPLFSDTKKPIIYGGLGLRAGADTRGGLRAGGSALVGLNLSPVVLQMAMEYGVGRFPEGPTEAGKQKGLGYAGVEGSVGVRVSKRVEIMALASLIGALKGPSEGSLQLGAGFSF